MDVITIHVPSFECTFIKVFTLMLFYPMADLVNFFTDYWSYIQRKVLKKVKIEKFNEICYCQKELCNQIPHTVL